MAKDEITTIEAAAILGLDPSAIRHRILIGTLKSEKRGRDHLVSRKAIQAEADTKKNGKVRGSKSRGKK